MTAAEAETGLMQMLQLLSTPFHISELLGEQRKDSGQIV